MGYTTAPVLKTGWVTGPVPLQKLVQAMLGVVAAECLAGEPCDCARAAGGGTKLEPAPSFGWLRDEPGLGLNSRIRG